MKRFPRRLFTEEFKREAIKLVTEQHLNPAAAGRQLDVEPIYPFVLGLHNLSAGNSKLHLVRLRSLQTSNVFER